VAQSRPHDHSGHMQKMKMCARSTATLFAVIIISVISDRAVSQTGEAGWTTAHDAARADFFEPCVARV
jgi:hypothetical protein